MNEESSEPEFESIKVGGQPVLAAFSLVAGTVVTLFCVWLVLGGWPNGQVPSSGLLAFLPAQFWGVLGTGWFGFLTLRGLRGLRSDSPRLEITEEGLINRSFVLSSGLIRWHEIETIRSLSFHAAEIVLRDPAEYHRRQPLWRRIASRLMSVIRMGPTTIFTLDLALPRGRAIDLVDRQLDVRELQQLEEQGLLGALDQETA